MEFLRILIKIKRKKIDIVVEKIRNEIIGMSFFFRLQDLFPGVEF